VEGDSIADGSGLAAGAISRHDADPWNFQGQTLEERKQELLLLMSGRPFIRLCLAEDFKVK
jgi:hypothetical protein